MSGGAVILIRQKRYVRCFRAAGAVEPARGRTLAELGVRSNWIFRHMARHGVFVQAPTGRWYLDEDAYRRFVARRYRRMAIFAAVAALVLFVLMLFRD